MQRAGYWLLWAVSMLVGKIAAKQAVGDPLLSKASLLSMCVSYKAGRQDMLYSLMSLIQLHDSEHHIN